MLNKYAFRVAMCNSLPTAVHVHLVGWSCLEACGKVVANRRKCMHSVYQTTRDLFLSDPSSYVSGFPRRDNKSLLRLKAWKLNEQKCVKVYKIAAIGNLRV